MWYNGPVRKRIACLVLLLVAVTSLFRLPPAQAQDERLVLAFYYAWFDMTTWQRPLPDQPSQPYASTDSAAIERHVAWARQAGIDALVQSWYGPQVTNNQTETNFAQLLTIAAGYGLRAAVDLEVTSPFIHSPADVVAALQHALTVHAAQPAYLRVGGRPVIFFWRQETYSVETWNSIREQVDPGRTSLWIAEGTNLDYLGPFDGNHLYSVAWDAAPEGTLVRWGQRVRDWSAAHGVSRTWVATVMPGYDDRVTGRPDAFVRERAGGDYYRRCWQGASASGADWVIITSFNEWMEGTQIEPSVSYGDAYLGLTRELADAYRAGTAPPVAPPTATRTTAEAPSAAPLPDAANRAPIAPTPAPGLSGSEGPTATPSPTTTPRPTPAPSATPTATSSPTVPPIATSTPPPSPTSTPTATPPPTLPQRAIAAVQAYPGLIAAGLALALAAVMAFRGRRGDAVTR